MNAVAHELAALLYLAAAGLAYRGLRSERSAPEAAWLFGGAVFLHAYAFVGLHLADPPLPLSSFPAALSLIGWLISTSFLLSLRIARVRQVVAWVAALSGSLTAFAALGLRYLPPPVADPASVAWSHAHVLLSTLGFSLLALASLCGVSYLVKERALKRKAPVGVALPSLESLDRMIHFALTLGYLLLTLGVATGFGWELARGHALWTGHSAWMLGAWVIYLGPIGMRVVAHQQGDRPARGVVLAFVLLAASYIGVRMAGGLA
jgi:ABC-type uncharacterized transport system permease subunit